VECPECRADVRDPDALYCPRCGARLAVPEGAATDRIDSGSTENAAPATARVTPGASPAEPQAPSETSEGPAALASDMVVALRRSLVTGGWVDAGQVAGFGFLAMLAVGALFAAVVKLSDPTFGSGESPLWVLEWVVLLGTLSIGVPVEGNMSISVLPLGSLLAIGWAISWAARRVVVRSSAATLGEHALEGAKAGVPFGILCLVASLVFRIDGASAGAGPALLLGCLWGALFGALGGVRAHGSLNATAGYLLGIAERRSVSLSEGIVAGATMLAGSAVLAAAAALLGLIVWLISADVSLEAGEVLLLVFLLAAFAPNIVAGVVGFALGAPVAFGGDFGFSAGGDYSLLGWGANGPAPFMYVALLIPAAACLFGGYVARRRSREGHDLFVTVGVAAVFLALVLTVVVALGNLDFGPSVTGPTAFELGPDAAGVLVLSLVWGAVFGYLGWKLGESSVASPDSGPTRPRAPSA
jgi:hypothetical protein